MRGATLGLEIGCQSFFFLFISFLHLIDISLGVLPPSVVLTTLGKFASFARSTRLTLAHSRNMTCIGCGSQRPTTATGSARQTGQPQQKFPSPRFAGAGSTPGFDLQNHASERRFSLPDTPKSPTSSFPVLTPSGRQFSIGGKVQNVSRDPMAPCFMFWSFNEPFPQPGQIRPPLSSDVQFPPILNTGNHGPIEKQQGDWCCTGSGPENPCGFLNWRRVLLCRMSTHI